MGWVYQFLPAVPVELTVQWKLTSAAPWSTRQPGSAPWCCTRPLALAPQQAARAATTVVMVGDVADADCKTVAGTC